MSNPENKQPDDSALDIDAVDHDAPDWTRPPKYDPVDKKIRHRMSKRVQRARVAITKLAEYGSPQMLSWLESAANGVPKLDLKGEPIRDGQGSVVYVVKPDPLGAFKAMADVMDYHLPRLSRQDVTMQAQIDTMPITELPTAVLKQRLFHALGLTPEEAATIIEGEAMPVKPEG